MKTMEQEFNEKVEEANKENANLKEQLNEYKLKTVDLEATINILFGGATV